MTAPVIGRSSIAWSFSLMVVRKGDLCWSVSPPFFAPSRRLAVSCWFVTLPAAQLASVRPTRLRRRRLICVVPVAVRSQLTPWRPFAPVAVCLPLVLWRLFATVTVYFLQLAPWRPFAPVAVCLPLVPWRPFAHRCWHRDYFVRPMTLAEVGPRAAALSRQPWRPFYPLQLAARLPISPWPARLLPRSAPARPTARVLSIPTSAAR